MSLEFIPDKVFKNLSTPPKQAEYDNCMFINCNFKEAYLSGFSFLECEFVDCDLSLTKLKDATFKETHFKNCKMVGFPLLECNPFLLSVKFSHKLFGTQCSLLCILSRQAFEVSPISLSNLILAVLIIIYHL